MLPGYFLHKLPFLEHAFTGFLVQPLTTVRVKDFEKMILPSDRVNHYLSEILEFPTWKKTLQEDEVGFLRDLVAKSVVKIYFQVSFSCKP